MKIDTNVNYLRCYCETNGPYTYKNNSFHSKNQIIIIIDLDIGYKIQIAQ